MDNEHDHDGDAAPAADPEIGGFAALGLSPQLLQALEQLGYEEPTPIQREAIPHLLRGADLLGQAATGTGKTAAFALPALELVPKGKGTAPVALVLAPTRELAVQGLCSVAARVHRLGEFVDLGAGAAEHERSTG